MLTVELIKKEFTRECAPKRTLKSLSISLLKGTGKVDNHVVDIWNNLLSVYKETKTPLEFYYMCSRANRSSLDISIKDIISNIGSSEEPLIYFIKLCENLGISVSELIKLANK